MSRVASGFSASSRAAPGWPLRAFFTAVGSATFPFRPRDGGNEELSGVFGGLPCSASSSAMRASSALFCMTNSSTRAVSPLICCSVCAEVAGRRAPVVDRPYSGHWGGAGPVRAHQPDVERRGAVKGIVVARLPQLQGGHNAVSKSYSHEVRRRDISPSMTKLTPVL